MTDLETIDITPTTKLLHVLGDIPFEPWQCLAELIDNSLDAFKVAQGKGTSVESPRIDIDWSEATDYGEKEIVIQDNGSGMPLGKMQDAVRAGYSSNDPIDQLGLFGMGFNIATAKLALETTLWSTQSGQKEWVGVRIDFDELRKHGKFQAKVVREEKADHSKSGTKVVMRKLRPDVLKILVPQRLWRIRETLGRVYSRILEQKTVEILIKQKHLMPARHCIWGKNRSLMFNGQEQIFAVQEIDCDLKGAWFNSESNSYLSEEECIMIETNKAKGTPPPTHIEERPRRLKGWLGIQRHQHRSNFGIDFIRNGRKILTYNKDLFSFNDPDTGVEIGEYPAELREGRIVGELEVDYLIPTYQKNDFIRTGRAWQLTVDAIRGAGPLGQKQRTSRGFSPINHSPLGKLFRAYRRTDAGTKRLSISTDKAKELYERFRNGDEDYQTDEKWYQIAKEIDRHGEKKGGPTHGGSKASDDPGALGPGSVDPPGTQTPTTPPPQNQSSSKDDLIQASQKIEALSGKYAYSAKVGCSVIAFDTEGAEILEHGKRVPARTFPDGVTTSFFFDRTHPLLAEYPLTEKQLMLILLSEQLSIRDQEPIHKVFYGLAERHMTEERIHQPTLADNARSLLEGLRERAPALLLAHMPHARDTIMEVESENLTLCKSLLDEDPPLLEEYNNVGGRAHEAFAYVPYPTLERLIRAYPEAFFDGKALSLPYTAIEMSTDDQTRELKEQSVGLALSYISDMCRLINSGTVAKPELARYMATYNLSAKIIL